MMSTGTCERIIVIKEIEIVFHISWFFRNEKGVDYMEIFIPG